MTRESSKYPSTFYRVSLKAIIRNDEGHVLLTKEDGYTWSFPGGGIEHGEDEMMALKRELIEEAEITEPFAAMPIGLEPIYADWADTWILWIFYDVKLPEGFTYGNGETVETTFKDPNEFKDSTNIFEQVVYRWAKKSPRL